MAPRGRPFVIGHPKVAGRAKGTLNRATVNARELAQRLLTDPEYVDGLERRLRQGELPPAVEAMLWNYAFGRPMEDAPSHGDFPVTFSLDIAAVSPQRPLLSSASTALSSEDEPS